MIDFSQRQLIAQLKAKFDQSLIQSYLSSGNGASKDDFPYSEKYPIYFKVKYINNIIMKMRPEVYKAYKEGSGHELDVGKGQTPPKFLSIGSSALFCYLSLENKEAKENEGAGYFAFKGDKLEKVEYEKVMPIFPDANMIHPHMDAYVKGEDREYFFECKSHEMFDDHPIRMSKRYFATGKDLITDYIPEEYLHLKKKIYDIDPEAFDLKGRTLFDVKQLLNHLMAIKCNKTMKNCSLIYYYALPKKEDIHDEGVLEIIDRVRKDAVTVFKSKLIRHYCDKNGIELSLYIKRFDISAANAKNTEKIY